VLLLLLLAPKRPPVVDTYLPASLTLADLLCLIPLIALAAFLLGTLAAHYLLTRSKL
jgi:hypothetical protein